MKWGIFTKYDRPTVLDQVVGITESLEDMKKYLPKKQTSSNLITHHFPILIHTTL
jgi:hypothetical protein